RLDVMESLPEQLAARIYVEEPSGLDAQVITPFRVIVGKAVLSEGVHPLIGTINDEVFYEGAFDVGGKEKPEPEPILRDAKIVIEPEHPAEGEEFTVFVEGVFPSPGYFIAEKSMYMTRSIPAHIVVNLKVLPLEGIVPHEDEPFKEEIGTAALSAGAHPVRGFMNDVLFYDSRLVVGDAPRDEYPIYKFAITFSPSDPAPGEPFDAYASGVFPTPGYQFSKAEMVVSDYEPTTLLASLVVEAPSGFVPEVETPFSQYLGTFTLGAGKYPVAADVNGDAIYRSSIKVGDTPPNAEWITFNRSGGFAGWTQNLYIGLDRSANITSDIVIDSSNRSGLVPQDSFDRLNELMSQIDFSVLETYYSREVPIADGYMYEITVNRDHTILFEQGAQAPTELSDLVFVLESILDGRVDLLRTFDSESSVSNWSMY
ncbi:hypothetical protein K8I31_02975, partial [bacterium]|nr:hypothetical protein [bacterium]